MATDSTRLSLAHPLAAEVLKGLQARPKQLSPVWFYDARGSALFDAICELPEYYITRTELQIMREHAPQMAQIIGPQAAIIELGSGSSLKTRLLLDELQQPAAYVPVDISREHLLKTARQLAADYPGLDIVPVVADFTSRFTLPPAAAATQRRIVYFPGSTLGNFERPQATQLLANVRELVGPQGAVLIGFDLRKDAATLERAYDDAQGITAQFNLNALRHVNRVLGADFKPDAFRHQAVWMADDSRIEMRLVSLHDQVVHLAGQTIAIARDEHIRTEYSHKYTLESFAALTSTVGLTAAHSWTDAEQRFCVQLLTPTQQ